MAQRSGGRFDRDVGSRGLKRGGLEMHSTRGGIRVIGDPGVSSWAAS